MDFFPFQEELLALAFQEEKQVFISYQEIYVQMQSIFFSKDFLLYKEVEYFLKENLEKRYKLEEVAARYFCCPRKMYDIFSQQTGYGFQKFYTGLKMEEANRLIIQGEMDIYEIMERVGYAHRSSFGKAFHRHFFSKERKKNILVD